MACRTPSRGQAAAEDVKNRTGATDKNVIFMQLDLASYASIRNFVTEFKKSEKNEYPFLDTFGIKVEWFAVYLFLDKSTQCEISERMVGSGK